MKNILMTFALLFSFTVFAQEHAKPKLEKQGDLVKATYFHENGEIAQQGFYKNTKPHGEWTAFDTNGKKIAIGEYNEGLKVGKWFFWNNKQLSEVDFMQSKIVAVNKWEGTTRVVLNK